MTLRLMTTLLSGFTGVFGVVKSKHFQVYLLRKSPPSVTKSSPHILPVRALKTLCSCQNSRGKAASSVSYNEIRGDQLSVQLLKIAQASLLIRHHLQEFFYFSYFPFSVHNKRRLCLLFTLWQLHTHTHTHTNTLEWNQKPPPKKRSTASTLLP